MNGVSRLFYAWIEKNRTRISGPIREVGHEEILTEIYAPISEQCVRRQAYGR